VQRSEAQGIGDAHRLEADRGAAADQGVAAGADVIVDARIVGVPDRHSAVLQRVEEAGRALGGDQVVKRQLGMQEGEVFLARVEQHEIVRRHVHQLERRDHAVEGEHRCAGVLQARDHRQQRLHGGPPPTTTATPLCGGVRPSHGSLRLEAAATLAKMTRSSVLQTIGITSSTFDVEITRSPHPGGAAGRSGP
jgi:hypothetical protein